MVSRKKVVSFAFSLFIITQAVSQIDYDKVPEATTKVFINDVFVQKDPSTPLGLSDILIENGLIADISPNLKPPYDAKVIEGDSSYAYAGFIDAFSHVGIPKSEAKSSKPDVRFKGYPPNDIVGITPEILASAHIVDSDPSIKTHVEVGFAISHTVPRGRMLPGQGVILSLNENNPEKMILKDQTSTFFQLKGTRGFFPSTTIGVMAKWRDLYRQAEYHNKNLKLYRTSSIGIPRPKEDKTLSALIPVTQGERSVYMTSEKVKDIFRAVALRDELGYNLVLCDVKQIGAAQKLLESKNIDLILSLDLPKKSKQKDKKDSTEINEKQKSLLKRKNESIKTYLSQAAELEKNNIEFSFSTMSGKVSDIKSNIITLIENGLSKKAALAALTTNPAKLLNIDKIVGTLEVGKIANVNISDKPYFEKDAKLRYVIIDGVITEIKQKSKNKKTNSNEFKHILGKWSFLTEVMGDENSGTINISDAGNEINIELTNDNNPSQILVGKDVSFDDSTLHFTITITPENQPIPLNIILEMNNDSFDGTIIIEGLGDFFIEGSKISSPD